MTELKTLKKVRNHEKDEKSDTELIIEWETKNSEWVDSLGSE